GVIRLVTAQTENTQVLEEPADDRTHPEPLGQTGDAGPQRAHAADDKVHLSPRLGRRVERVDDVRVDEVVDLDDDPAARLRLSFDELGDAGSHARGRDQQIAVAVMGAVGGEEVAELYEWDAGVGGG